MTGDVNPARLSNQLDFNVWNQNGEQIGDVDDMVLDLDNSRVSYVVVGTGGFLEIGEKEVVVPWDSLQLQTGTGDTTGNEQNAFILQTDQDTFNNAPDVDLNDILPPTGNPAGDWDKDIRSYWESGVIPNTPSVAATILPEMTATVGPETTAMPEETAPVAAPLQDVMLASEAPDSSIRVQGQDDLNVDVDDMIVNVETGEIRYIVVKANFDDGERWIPVPLGSLQWDTENEEFVLNVDAATLQNTPAFGEGQYPDTTVSGWDRDIATYWQNNGNGSASGAAATPTP